MSFPYAVKIYLVSPPLENTGESVNPSRARRIKPDEDSFVFEEVFFEHS